MRVKLWVPVIAFRIEELPSDIGLGWRCITIGPEGKYLDISQGDSPLSCLDIALKTISEDVP